MSHKRPKISNNIPEPSSQKKVKNATLESTNDANPSWRFTKLELVDPFGWHTIQTDQLHFIREKLQNFESMTWNEILVQGKKFNHAVKTSGIVKEAKDRLKSLYLDDVEELVSLRLAGEQRIWGIRQGVALLLLWWDPEHKVYPSQKKHT